MHVEDFYFFKKEAKKMKKFLLCSLLFLLMQILMNSFSIAKQANYEADKDALLNLSLIHISEPTRH